MDLHYDPSPCSILGLYPLGGGLLSAECICSDGKTVQLDFELLSTTNDLKRRLLRTEGERTTALAYRAHSKLFQSRPRV